MKRLGLLIALLASVMGMMAQEAEQQPKKERFATWEPSILINVMGGATYLDAQWKNEFNLDVAMGAQFRNGHAVYIGMTMQQLQRQKDYKDMRTSRTNMPIYAQYQWRAFGWNKDMADSHSLSPFVGVKAGWNFLQDVIVNESVTFERQDDLKNNYFITPQVGFDWRFAEYMALGIIVECEVSRRYVGDSNPTSVGAWFKPRAGVCLKF